MNVEDFEKAYYGKNHDKVINETRNNMKSSKLIF